MNNKVLQERLVELRRLEMAGVESDGRPNCGKAVILWTRKRDGAEKWEVLPEGIAQLVIADMHNDVNVERAVVYHRIPENAPDDVAKAWLCSRMKRHLTNSTENGTI